MGDQYHFIGIGGIGMSGLARLLLSQNIPVTGSDIAFNSVIEGLIQAGAVIHKGQAAEHVAAPTKVVYCSDIKPDNPEYQAAVRLQCALLHRSDLLAELMQGKCALAVAGTHGKTTTSALLATVLMDAQLDPSFAIGGMLPAFQSNARFGKGDFFAFEADESDRTFLKYHPLGAIVTNIDNDHLNNYEGSENLLVEAFQTFISQVQSPQHLFWCGEDAHLVHLNIFGQCYGFAQHCQWRIVSLHQMGFRLFFDIEHEGHLYRNIELSLTGRHNVLNAAAVFGLALSLGISEEGIRQTFKTFRGVLRRCEQKGTSHGVLFLDDYGHHPTEIQTTLHGIRQAIGAKRLIAVFQPHRYSRTRDCLGLYGSIFEDADEILLTDIYGAGELPIPQISHTLIQQEIQQCCSLPCHYVPRSALSRYLSQCIQPCDVVVTLGAGDVTKVGLETINLLENQPQSRFKVGFIWDYQTISACKVKEDLELFSSPYWIPYHFSINRQGHWVMGSEMQQLENLNAKENIFSTAVMQQLLSCDVLVPILTSKRQDALIQSFLEVIGKAYVGCGQRFMFLNEVQPLVKQLLTMQGIRLTSMLEHFDQGVFVEFLMIGQEIHRLTPSIEEIKDNGFLMDSFYSADGEEIAKKVYQALDCQGGAFIRLFLDDQQVYWFDRLLPLAGEALLSFIKSLSQDQRLEEKGMDQFIILALQNKRLRDRS